VGTALIVAGCAEPLTPSQQRAQDAFKDCWPQAPSASITYLPPQGGIHYAANPGDREIMARCLSERHGYRSR